MVRILHNQAIITTEDKVSHFFGEHEPFYLQYEFRADGTSNNYIVAQCSVHVGRTHIKHEILELKKIVLIGSCNSYIVTS